MDPLRSLSSTGFDFGLEMYVNLGDMANRLAPSWEHPAVECIQTSALYILLCCHVAYQSSHRFFAQRGVSVSAPFLVKAKAHLDPPTDRFWATWSSHGLCCRRIVNILWLSCFATDRNTSESLWVGCGYDVFVKADSAMVSRHRHVYSDPMFRLSPSPSFTTLRVALIARPR